MKCNSRTSPAVTIAVVIAMAHRLLIPEGFDAVAIVGPLKADSAKWLVSTVLRKAAVKDVDARGYAILSSTVLQRIMGDGYARIIRSLIAEGVLQRSSYRTGKSFGYRLAEEHLAGHPRRVPITNPILIGRLDREFKQEEAEQAARRLPIHDALNEAQQGLTILPSAKATVEALPAKSRLCQRVHVDRIERNELPFSISTTGRVFNGLSGLKRELRADVRLDHQPIGCVDIRNSQPAILGCLLTAGFPTNGVKGALTYSTPCGSPLPSLLTVASSPSCLSFAGVASAGLLYDELAEVCGLDRGSVKKRFLVDVLAKRGSYPSEVESAFRGRFPEVWEAIQGINKDSHCALIRLLQRAESWLVIEQVAPKLLGSTSIVTLHDAIYSRSGDVETVEGAFSQVCDEIGFRLSLKRE